MPPPRRRRPVQPATRVRLPRTARPRGTPATETPGTETPGTETPGTETPAAETRAAETPAAETPASQQINSTVNMMFSYNYADTAKTSRAAAALLTGRAKGEYNTLFKLVRLDAPKEKLVLTTTVTNSGVEYLVGNQARVLIFANQQDTAGSAHKTTDAGAMFAVNAVYQGGRWKIAHIDTFRAGG